MTAISTTTATEERALRFLGEGHTIEVTASACGVSVSRISQLLSDENFAARVAQLRYDRLLQNGKRLDAYEEIEDKVLARLKESLSMIFDPLKLARILQVIAGAKPRTTFQPAELPAAQQVVPLVLPQFVVNHFTTNIHNQVTEIHSEQKAPQTLVTIQSSALERLSAASSQKRLQNDRITEQIPAPQTERTFHAPALNAG